MNIKTPNEIDQVIKSGQYKYIELIAAGKKYGGYNQTPAKLKAKIESIKKFLETFGAGIYTLNFKINPGGDVFTYNYYKGNFSEDNITPAPVYQAIPITPPLEKFQTLDEWKKQEQRINELEQQLAILKITNELKQPMAEPAEPEKNIFLGFAENILPSFMPVIDKYFTIKDRELAIKEQRNNQIKTTKVKAPIKIKTNNYRPVPEIGAPEFINYINYFLQLDENNAERELDFLEQNNETIYKYIISNYYENETDQDVQ